MHHSTENDIAITMFFVLYLYFFKPSPLLKNSLIRIISLIAGFVTIFKIKRGCRIQMQKAFFDPKLYKYTASGQKGA